jgi:hypothetical protein
MPSKRKPAPAPPDKGELISLRLSADLLAGIDAARGTMARSVWLRDVVERAVVTNDVRAIREVLAYARARGVTLEMLAEAVPLLGR